MSTTMRPSGRVWAMSPTQAVVKAKLSRAAACSAAGASVARNRGFSNWIANLLPIRRNASNWVGPNAARSSPMRGRPQAAAQGRDVQEARGDTVGAGGGQGDQHLRRPRPVTGASAVAPVCAWIATGAANASAAHPSHRHFARIPFAPVHSVRLMRAGARLVDWHRCDADHTTAEMR